MTDDFGASGRDRGSDIAHDLGDGPPGALRDTPPDILGPIDAAAPISGHVRAPESTGAAASHAPEHDWAAALAVIVPVLRPAGTVGLHLDQVDRAALVANANKAHTLPLLSDGPCGLVVSYALPATGFDVLVNGEHLLSWNVEPDAVHATAMANLAAWSAGADWSDEVSGDRRLLSSDTGSGLDASRILLPEVRAYLAAQLGLPGGRILIGLPDRHLLMAGPLRSGDDDFAALLRDFVSDHNEGADEPIDRRVFELTEAGLVEFAG
ncbi:MAG: hypothetical protein ACXWWR_03225 [Candidatus Limnocylindrales bacterium]